MKYKKPHFFSFFLEFQNIKGENMQLLRYLISSYIFLVFFEASPNKQRTKVVIEQNKATALIAFSDEKRVDYESIDIVQEAHTSKTKKE